MKAISPSTLNVCIEKQAFKIQPLGGFEPGTYRTPVQDFTPEPETRIWLDITVVFPINVIIILENIHMIFVIDSVNILHII